MCPSPKKSPWSYLPESIRVQAVQRWGTGKRGPGLGDHFVYHWVHEEPAPGYCGPLPTGRLVRRSREG
jgi:hypothetical protein